MRFVALAAGLMSVAIATSADAAVIFDTITGVTANTTAPVRIAAPGNPQRLVASPGNPGNAVIGNGGPLATSFVLTNTTTITSVVLNLMVSYTGGSGGAVVYIVPDNGSGMPVNNGLTGQSFAFGSGAITVGSIADSSIGLSPTLAPLSTSQILTPGTYWLAVEADMDLNTPGIQQGVMNYTSAFPLVPPAPNVTNSMRWVTATGFTPSGANLSGQGTGKDFAQFTSGTPNVYSTPTLTMPGVFMATIEGTIVTSEQEAPEPATLAVLGAGLVGMGLVRRLRNRKTQA